MLKNYEKYFVDFYQRKKGMGKFVKKCRGKFYGGKITEGFFIEGFFLNGYKIFGLKNYSDENIHL